MPLYFEKGSDENMSKTRTKSKRAEMAENGVLNASYTQTQFVKVKPAYGIDKVCFSFVIKGTNGSGFKVYVDLDTFYSWMEDIESGMFFNVISKEKQAGQEYPAYYKYVTGENGEKTVGFAASKKGGYLINATDNGSKLKPFNIPVSRVWLQTLKRYFLATVDKHFNALVETTLVASETYQKADNKASTEATKEDAKKKENPATKAVKAVKEVVNEVKAVSTVNYLNKTLRKAGETSKKVNANGKIFYLIPANTMGMGNSFSKKVDNLFVSEDEYDAAKSIIESKPEKLSAFEVKVEENKGMYKFVSFIREPSMV